MNFHPDKDANDFFNGKDSMHEGMLNIGVGKNRVFYAGNFKRVWLVETINAQVPCANFPLPKIKDKLRVTIPNTETRTEEE